MSIQAVKHINKNENNRIEFLFVDFDYFDGNDLIARLFNEEFQMKSSKKVEGIFFSIIRLQGNSSDYELVWHEDVGNYIYSINQDKASIAELEKKLKVIVDKLNGITTI